MGEYYWGDLELTIPDTMPSPLSTADGTPLGDMTANVTWDMDGWMLSVFGTTDENDLLPPQEERLAAMVELLDKIEGWVVDATNFELEDRTIKIGGEHNFGIAHWYETLDVEETCQQHGIAYRMWDDGKYEYPGEEREWKPGMETAAARGHSAAGTVLDRSEMNDLFAKADGNLAAFGQLVRDYFGDVDDLPPCQSTSSAGQRGD